MKKFIIVILSSMIFIGCVSDDYYVRPDSKGYTIPYFDALCENCNRYFKFSAHQADNFSISSCIYCGHKQDLMMAHNRAIYEKQKENEKSWHEAAKAWQEFADKLEKERQEEIRYQNEMEMRKFEAIMGAQRKNEPVKVQIVP